MEANQTGQEETIARAKKYAAAAKYAQRRGQHRRAALLYTVAATLLDPTFVFAPAPLRGGLPTGPRLSPLTARVRQR